VRGNANRVLADRCCQTSLPTPAEYGEESAVEMQFRKQDPDRTLRTVPARANSCQHTLVEQKVLLITGAHFGFITVSHDRLLVLISDVRAY